MPVLASGADSSSGSVGGTIEAYYLMTGPQDGFIITDVPDALSAAAISQAVTSTGLFNHLETHDLIPAADMNALLEKAKNARAAYSAPGT